MREVEGLKSYREKRDFRRTPEPAGGKEPAQGEALFVIQKHSARREHYDLRLQVNNVLKSWAVPKGPSTDPSQKRLAVATDDHPLEYADFEGVIPKGEYGAGKMIVWDTGSYRNITKKAGKVIPIADAIEHGHIAVWLEGKKLKGGFALNRFRTGPKEQWLLVKMDDQGADRDDALLQARPESVLTQRSLEEVGASQDENNEIHIERAVKLVEKLTGSKQSKPDSMPSHLDPMLALLSRMPRDVQAFAFEYKWDGIRALCYWDGEPIRLEGRNELDITFRWPELMKLGEVFGPTAVILDGGIVALDSKNRVSFALLSRRMHLGSKPTAAQIRSVPIVYMIFDILYLKDRSLINLSYMDRRSILKELSLSGDKWQIPDAVSEDPEVILEAALVGQRQGCQLLPGKRLAVARFGWQILPVRCGCQLLPGKRLAVACMDGQFSFSGNAHFSVFGRQRVASYHDRVRSRSRGAGHLAAMH
jgi:DNA ligase D-like protein (predicted 3'-phosphoesterase)